MNNGSEIPIKELKTGDGGYILNLEGEVLPINPDELQLYQLDDEDPSLMEVPSFETNAELGSDLTQQEKLRLFKETYGFYPEGSRELDYAVGIPPKGTAKYLNTILWHQKESTRLKKLDNPNDKELQVLDDDAVARRSLASVVTHFIKCQKEAKANTHFLHELKNTVEDYGIPDKGLIATVDGVRRGFIDLIMHDDIANFTDEPDTKKKLKFKDIKARRELIDDYLEGVSVEDLFAAIDDSIEQQTLRRLFWTEKIKEAGFHMAVSAIVNKALNPPGSPPQN